MFAVKVKIPSCEHKLLRLDEGTRPMRFGAYRHQGNFECRSCRSYPSAPASVDNTAHLAERLGQRRISRRVFWGGTCAWGALLHLFEPRFAHRSRALRLWSHDNWRIRTQTERTYACDRFALLRLRDQVQRRRRSCTRALAQARVEYSV